MNKHPTNSLTIRLVVCVMAFCTPLFSNAAFPGSFGGSPGGEMSNGGTATGVQTGGAVVLTTPQPFGGRTSNAGTSMVQAPASTDSRGGAGSAPGQTYAGPGTTYSGTSGGQFAGGSNASYFGETDIATQPSNNSPQSARSRYQVFTNPDLSKYKGGIRVITGTAGTVAASRAPVRAVYVPISVPVYSYIPAPAVDITSTPDFTVYTATPAFNTYTPNPTYSNFAYPQFSGLEAPAYSSPVVYFQVPQWVFPGWVPSLEMPAADYTNRVGSVSAPTPAPVENSIHIIHIVH